MLKDTPTEDRYCCFTYNPHTGGHDRQWIQYADGTFEPVRRNGALSRKWNGEQTAFRWWQEDKPASWRPEHDGFAFAWNHRLGEEGKPDDWGDRSERERGVGAAPYFIGLELGDDDRIAQRTERIHGRRETWNFQYDEAGRLTGAESDTGWSQGFEYDEEGRRSRDAEVGRTPFSRVFVYGEDNRLLQAGEAAYEHDELGFRSVRRLGEAVARYAYSPDCRLLGVDLPDGRAVRYGHDQDGLRSVKAVGGVVEELYVWRDFLRLDSFEDEVNRWRFLYDGHRLPYAAEVNGTQYSMHYDQVGSLKAVVSPSGAVVKTVQYGSFGEALWDSDPNLRVPLGFAGGLYDPDTGFVRFGWRDYDPDTGRWTAQDPLGDAGGDPDWYGYCLDDPVNLVDPLGLFWSSRGGWSNARDKAKSAHQHARDMESKAKAQNDPGHDTGGNSGDDMDNSKSDTNKRSVPESPKAKSRSRSFLDDVRELKNAEKARGAMEKHGLAVDGRRQKMKSWRNPMNTEDTNDLLGSGLSLKPDTNPQTQIGDSFEEDNPAVDVFRGMSKAIDDTRELFDVGPEQPPFSNQWGGLRG